MPDLIYNVKFQIEDNLGSISTASEQSERKVKELQQQVAELNAQLRLAGSKSNPINKLPVQAQNVGKSFSTANQAVFSFSDGIQDSAQFSQGFSQGMRAVGNNVGFTAELFASLERNVDEYNQANGTAITRLDALKGSIFRVDEQGRAFAGGLKNIRLTATGLVLGLNLAITAFTVISQAISNSRKETEKAAKEADNYTSKLRELKNLGMSDFGVVEEIESQQEALLRQIEVLEERSELQEEREKIISEAMSNSRTETVKLTEADEERLKQIDESQKGISAYVNFLGIEESTIESLTAKYDRLALALGFARSGTDDVRTSIGVFVDEMTTRADRALDRFNAGLGDNLEPLTNQRDTLEQTIANFQTLAEEGKTEYIPFINALKKPLEDVNKALEGYDLAEAFEFPEDLILGEDLEEVIALDARRLFRRVNDEKERSAVDFNQLSLDIERDGLAMFKEILDEEVEAHGKAMGEMERQTARSHLAQMRLDKQLEVTRLDALQRLVSSTSQAIQALFGESKGVAIAEATINTFLAMTKARSMYAPPIGGILAAAELASGIATIANIAKTEIGSSTLSGGGGDSAPSSALRTFGTGSSLPDSRTLTRGDSLDTGRAPIDIASNQMRAPIVNVYNTANVDSKGLYITTQHGRKEYERSTTQ